MDVGQKSVSQVELWQEGIWVEHRVDIVVMSLGRELGQNIRDQSVDNLLLLLTLGHLVLNHSQYNGRENDACESRIGKKQN